MLSPHFSEKEFGLIGCPKNLIDNGMFLCATILEPTRDHFNAPIHIHDAYRDANHNKRVGGKPDSFHLFTLGRAAADIDVAGKTLIEVFDWMRLQSHLQFDKIILEHYPNGVPATIHIQVDRTNPPRRLAYVGGTGNSQIYTLVQVN